MEEKRINLMWSFSLMTIGIAAVILAVTNIAGVELPDLVRRLFGLAELIALPLFAYSFVMKWKQRR